MSAMWWVAAVWVGLCLVFGVWLWCAVWWEDRKHERWLRDIDGDLARLQGDIERESR